MDVWVGRGFSPQQGVLRLVKGRLTLLLDGGVAFDSPVAGLQLKWPWYGGRAQFWAHAGEKKYYVSFLHTGNSMVSWWKGMQKGRFWNRAIMKEGNV